MELFFQPLSARVYVNLPEGINTIRDSVRHGLLAPWHQERQLEVEDLLDRNEELEVSRRARNRCFAVGLLSYDKKCLPGEKGSHEFGYCTYTMIMYTYIYVYIYTCIYIY